MGYKAVVGWVAHAPRDRATLLPQLLQHVHFPLMSMDEVELSSRSHLVKKNKNLATALEEARTYLAKNTQGKQDYWSSKPKPARWPKIFVVMRMYWKNLPMEYYDFKSKTWRQLTPVQSWRSCTALVGHKHNIYLLGGEEVDPESPTGSRTVNRVTRYDCERHRWSGAWWLRTQSSALEASEGRAAPMRSVSTRWSACNWGRRAESDGGSLQACPLQDLHTH